jgi:hypothetical protein
MKQQLEAEERRTESANLSIAQCIRRSSDPYRASIAAFTSRDASSDKRKIFYFEDGSFLSFEITYTAVDDGVGLPAHA